MNSYINDTQSTHELIRTLSSIGKEEKHVKGKMLNFKSSSGEGVIYILHHGEVNLLRKSDKLIMNTYYGDDIIGLIEAFKPQDHHCLQVAKDSIMLIINAKRVISEIERRDNWYHLSVTLAQMLNHLYHRDRILLRQKADEIVRGSIIELNNLPDEIKKDTNLVEYIERRCPVSKRTVERTIRLLAERGSIETKGGKLSRINFLPVVS